MSSVVKRTVATYLVLVGVPIAGLVWVMRAGVSLEAPPVVGGAWEVVASPDAATCFGIEPGDTLRVEQSGRYLRVHAAEASADGRVVNGHVRADLVAPGGSCAGLTLAIDGTPAGDTVSWNLSAPGCAACPSSRLDARRPTE